MSEELYQSLEELLIRIENETNTQSKLLEGL